MAPIKHRDRRMSVTWKSPNDDPTIRIATLTGVDSIIKRMEDSLALAGRRQSRKSLSVSNKNTSSEKLLETFRSIVRSVMLILRCFRMRRKIAVQSDDLTFTHQIKTVDMSATEKKSISCEIRMKLCTPPDLRSNDDVKKVTSFLRANGAIRSMLGQTSQETEYKFGRLVGYESYEDGRVLAQQGRFPERFYYVIRGKILVVQEYHVGNSVISKTIAGLTKGCTTSVEDLDRDCSERKQSLVCRGAVECFVLDRDDYFLLRQDKTDGAKEYLSQHRFMKLFPTQLLCNQQNILEMQYYPKDSVVFPGGHHYDWVYIIKTGECSLVRTQYVEDVVCRKRALFNKPTSQELGCAKNKRNSSVELPLAGFQMYKPLNRLHTAPAKINSASLVSSTHLSRSTECITSPSSDQISTMARKGARKIPDPPSDVIPEESDVPKHDLKSLKSSSVTFPDLPGNRPLTYQSGNVQTRSFARSAPPMLRRAHLELGRLKAGDVYGLDDLVGDNDDVTRIALLSKGADVIKIRRSFFLRHAPANLLIQLSSMNHDFPTVNEARSALEATETWQMYKSALMDIVTSSHRNQRDGLRTQSVHAFRTTSRRQLHSRCTRSQISQRTLPLREENKGRESAQISAYSPRSVRRKNGRNAHSAPTTQIDQISIARRRRLQGDGYHITKMNLLPNRPAYVMH